MEFLQACLVRPARCPCGFWGIVLHVHPNEYVFVHARALLAAARFKAVNRSWRFHLQGPTTIPPQVETHARALGSFRWINSRMHEASATSVHVPSQYI